MRFLFKTNYDQDIKLFQHEGQICSYAGLLAVMLIAPLFISQYLQSQLVFVMIYAIVGVALMILTGFTGQGSLGHAAFLAIGAYTAGYLQSKGFVFWQYFLIAGALTGLIGAIVGFPALRLHGIYLLIATISFGFIVEEILARWESVTHGNEGMRIPALNLFGFTISRNSDYFYYLCLAVLTIVMIGALNLMRSPTGRAFIAIRDSETAAKSMGINLAAYKVKAFAISAAITGLAGSLYAHKMSFISPEMFTLILSIEFIMVIIIGGAIGLHGAVLGAIFIVMLDPLITLAKDDLPRIIGGLADTFGASTATAQQIQAGAASLFSAAGLKGAIYGGIIILFILFEPYGLYGRWLKIKLFFQMFPMYKKATFKRQKTYVKSERNR
jgi:branched-chain amino acid transport system permease protein